MDLKTITTQPDSTSWKDLVHKRDTVNDPHEWRYYVEEDERDFFDIAVHPDLMFNFWHESLWIDGPVAVSRFASRSRVWKTASYFRSQFPEWHAQHDYCQRPHHVIL